MVVATFFARGFRGADVFFAVGDFLAAAGVFGATPFVSTGFVVARLPRALGVFLAGLADASADGVCAAGAAGASTGADASTGAAGVATAAALDD
jgi:hypothetical protein